MKMDCVSELFCVFVFLFHYHYNTISVFYAVLLLY